MDGVRRSPSFVDDNPLLYFVLPREIVWLSEYNIKGRYRKLQEVQLGFRWNGCDRSSVEFAGHDPSDVPLNPHACDYEFIP